MNQLQNYVQLIGHLGQAPERIGTTRDTASAMVRFSLATNESYVNKNNERIDNTSWHTCITYGKRAEAILKYCKKGSRIAVQGSINYNKYQDKTGVNRMSTSIRVSNFMFLSNKS